MRPDDRLLVLDVHGVIFTNPLVPFIAETAERLGREREEALRAWTTRLRRPFWLGEVSVEQLWSTLFPGCPPAGLTAELEERYEAGPFLGALDAIDGPVWLLSNHRTEWLLPRISRFGLDGRFERIYVSDAIGFVKPEAGAFRFVQDVVGDRRVRYIDDKAENVAAAAAVFDESIHVRDAVERPHAVSR